MPVLHLLFNISDAGDHHGTLRDVFTEYLCVIIITDAKPDSHWQNFSIL
jgi:hypothetical protein